MMYVSTRDSERKTSASEAILTGLAPDGGLFVPDELPVLPMKSLLKASYTETAMAILAALLPDYDKDFLKQAIESSYGASFGGKAGYLAKLDKSLYSLELWHGPTAAFKDYALQLMPKLLVESRRMKGEAGETIILVATSGDTGSAALAGYSDIPGVKIAVFYPDNGTSELQRLQMTTQQGENVAVFAVNGNFDDAQRGVKAAFVNQDLADKLAAKGASLSSANSINWGRLSPQIVYYVTSYMALCRDGAVKYGQPVDFCVPTGNFGDIMAGWYAKRMGLPIGRLICASNKNNVLTDFLDTGIYNSKRTFYKTSSPSMDILVSSNLERLLWHTSKSNEKVNTWMHDLAEKGQYSVDKQTLASIREDFAAGWANETAVYQELRQTWDQYQYLCDPHTAVGFHILRQYRASNPVRPTVVLSTASPYKFSRQVLAALDQSVPQGDFDALHKLEEYSRTKAPQSLACLQDKPVRFNAVINPEEIISVPLSLE